MYADIREQFGDMDKDNDLVKYFTMVLARREEGQIRRYWNTSMARNPIWGRMKMR